MRVLSASIQPARRSERRGRRWKESLSLSLKLTKKTGIFRWVREKSRGCRRGARAFPAPPGTPHATFFTGVFSFTPVISTLRGGMATATAGSGTAISSTPPLNVAVTSAALTPSGSGTVLKNLP